MAFAHAGAVPGPIPFLSQAQRAIRLQLGRPGLIPEGLVLAQRIDIHEGVCSGLVAHVTCLGDDASLPLKRLAGLPIAIQLVTDLGGLRRFHGIVTEVRAGPSDGGLASFQLTARDVLAVMERGAASRVFLGLDVVEISRIVLTEWLHASPALATAFDFDLSLLDSGRYPRREFTHQLNESPAAFLRRLWKRAGIAWVIRPIEEAGAFAPRHLLVLFDTTIRLPANAAGELRYHRDAATEERNAITLWAPERRIVPGKVARASWDYKAATMTRAEVPTRIDQGQSGNALAAALRDAAIEVPHAADSWDDHDRLATTRIERHEFDAKRVHGLSGQTAIAAGEWNRITGHAAVDSHPAHEREYVFVEVHHLSENNLPKELRARAQQLFAAAEGIAGWAPFATPFAPAAEASEARDDRRYRNRFVAVRRDTPIVPPWNPAADLPPAPLVTALVVGPPGEEVHCDALGRVHVQFQGLEAADHAHAQGAGTRGDAADSAPIRVACALAGAAFGINHLPRIGTEVLVGFLGNDPDKPVILDAVHGGRTPPARFSHIGNLPGNRYLSGTKTKEIRGHRYNQLRFDDTPGQISVQLASEHAASQLNLGYLTGPRDQGHAGARGEGFELRSDAGGAIRSGRGLLISAWRQTQAQGHQLDAGEAQAPMDECLALARQLGEYAGASNALAGDAAPGDKLAADLKAAPGGSNTDPQGVGGAPAIRLTAPAGIAATTPAAIVQCAGTTIDQVAQQNLQLTSGGATVLQAGRGLSLFAHEEGIRVIAHHGKLLAQSQHDDTQIDAAKDLKLSAGAKLIGIGQDEITLMTAGGAYIKLKGGDVEIGGPGIARIRTAGHRWEGPASQSGELPQFGQGDLARTPQLVRATDGRPVEGVEARIEQEGAGLLGGNTDAAGKGPELASGRLERFKALFRRRRA